LSILTSLHPLRRGVLTIYSIMLFPIKKKTLLSDFDERITLYTYEDRTKEELQKEAERLTFKAEYCGCPHDCCGCLVEQDAEVTSDNTIEVIEIFNF